MSKNQKILSLCDDTHIWGSTYEDNYEVVYIDLRSGFDVRTLEHISGPVHGCILQPPCTALAGSGARWWKAKGEQALLEALGVVDACLRTVALYRPRFWVLENPVGRLSRYLGPPAHTYQPNEYGDAYTKRTCLWGVFTMPQPDISQPAPDDRIHKMSPGPDRGRLRSITPTGFAQQFRRYNP